jgi:hypothetical protein
MADPDETRLASIARQRWARRASRRWISHSPGKVGRLFGEGEGEGYASYFPRARNRENDDRQPNRRPDCASHVPVFPLSLLIGGLSAALRQILHLSDCPNLPSHLSSLRIHDQRKIEFVYQDLDGRTTDRVARR